ncbi:MAG: DUF493 family protein [Bacteroidota bacterium]
MSWDEIAFKEKLENTHVFPGKYIFKFIVKPVFEKKVIALVADAEIKVKPSSANKYRSITLTKNMASSEEVIDVYKRAYSIEGIIAL